MEIRHLGYKRACLRNGFAQLPLLSSISYSVQTKETVHIKQLNKLVTDRALSGEFW